jgi:hypothetical protein
VGDAFYPTSWNIPEDVSGVIAVAAGAFHAMASLADHSVRVWGENWAGQCDVPPGLKQSHGMAGGGEHTVAVVGLDPTVADSDGDGLPDGWEFAGNFNPCDPAMD